MSYPFKICDPIHGFIRFGPLEKQVIASSPFQRLRYIRQMAVAYLIYPGATHSRFEHSLGVMELATRIYNTLIEPDHRHTSFTEAPEELDYWRTILRLAALCHDLGHLPFSHTAEKALLPNGGHEEMTLKLIYSAELQPIWKQLSSHAAEDIAKLSVHAKKNTLSPWERVLSQIITEDSFGADRMDYLLRDGYYTGVGYGYFDYHQLIDCLRILPEDKGLSLGTISSGIQSVESLLIARYMMYARVYQHPKVRIYTHHMDRFMQQLFSKSFSEKVEEYLDQTDYTVLTSLARAAREGNYDAKCLFKQEAPFQEIFIQESRLNKLKLSLKASFGEDIFIDEHLPKENSPSFHVLTDRHHLLPCIEASAFLRDIPHGIKLCRLYAHPQKVELVYNKIS